MLASGPTSIIGLRGKPRHGAIRAKRAMAKSRAQSRCGNPVFFSSIDTLGIVGSGEDKSDQRRVSPNVVSPSYVVNLVSVGGAAYVRRPQSWGRRARRTGKEGPGVLGGILHAGFRVQVEQTTSSFCLAPVDLPELSEKIGS
jgi:hypothetical protein